MKCLLPWEPNGDGFVRKQFGRIYKDPNHCAARIFPHIDGWRSIFFGLTENYKTPEEAMAVCDKYLTNMGRYLIKKDEVERFEKKLKLLL